MATAAKQIILVFVGHYRPGFKAGGILRSIENLVDHLHREFQFMIVTRDRDLGDDQPYPNIRHCEWQVLKNARVYYLAPSDESLQKIRRVVRETPHDLIYLNSFFEPLTIRVLFNRKLSRTEHAPIVLAPRGEFAWASLRQRYPKKAVFMALARTIALYRGIAWHASSDFEADDIVRVMKVRRDAIRVALNLPIVTDQARDGARPIALARQSGGLRVVFLARISPEKNLAFALQLLSRVRAPITFDIIGPIDDADYWKKCETLLLKMPDHVISRYAGSINPAEIMPTLSQYDLLLFPSGGENYAHVIAEALACGTPVLTSVHTPWRNLETRGLGWDLPLDKPESFVRVIDTLAAEGEKDRSKRRRIIKENIRSILDDPLVLDANRQLFNLAIAPQKN